MRERIYDVVSLLVRFTTLRILDYKFLSVFLSGQARLHAGLPGLTV
jgi:hypothetical protein